MNPVQERGHVGSNQQGHGVRSPKCPGTHILLLCALNTRKVAAGLSVFPLGILFYFGLILVHVSGFSLFGMGMFYSMTLCIANM